MTNYFKTSLVIGDLLLFPSPRLVECLAESDGLMAVTPLGSVTEWVEDVSLPSQGFKLRIGDGKVVASFGDVVGHRYGEQLVEQIRTRAAALGSDELPPCEIVDWPDFLVRGYMLDISRDRVPRMETLERLVEILSMCRVNHLELYTEHTFAYRDHEVVWQDASPMTGQEIQTLDRLCAAAGVELVASQNTFGHMGRWLKHDQYAHRSEMVGKDKAETLEPSEDNAKFAIGLCQELVGYHRTKNINIGFDEPADLGRGRSRQRCEQESVEQVYVEHLSRLVEGLHNDDVGVLFWGDVLNSHPHLAAELPTNGLTALIWNYEPGGFEQKLDSFAGSGLPVWVCPGTCSWNSLIGRLDTAKSNLLDAARAGLARGVEGYLITDWGDNGHHQPFAVSLPPLVFGAGTAWCADSNASLDLAMVLDELVFEDEAKILGGLLDRIGRLHPGSGVEGTNASPYLVALLSDRVRAANYDGLELKGEVDEAMIQAVVASLAQELQLLEDARPGCLDGDQVLLELRTAILMARAGVRRMAIEAGVGTSSEAGFLDDFGETILAYRRAWLGRSRQGGLGDSIAKIDG